MLAGVRESDEERVGRNAVWMSAGVTRPSYGYLLVRVIGLLVTRRVEVLMVRLVMRVRVVVVMRVVALGRRSLVVVVVEG